MYLEVENTNIFPPKCWFCGTTGALMECQGFQGHQAPAVLCAKTNGNVVAS